MTMEKAKILGNFLTQADMDFPLDCETLENMQGLACMCAVVGNVAGDKAVLHGCEATADGSVRAPGYVFLRTRAFPEGEVLYWEGGAVGGGMHVREEAVRVRANNKEYPKAYTRRSLAPGSGDESYGWDGFTELRTLAELRKDNDELRARLEGMRLPPLGVIELWAGVQVPEGYVLCDGRALRRSDYAALAQALGGVFDRAADADGNAYGAPPEGFFRVPDLRGRFVVGRHDSDDDYGTPGSAGGLKSVALSVEEMPAHSHEAKLHIAGSDDWRSGGSHSPDNMTMRTATTVYGTGSAGGGMAHENRPPYYVLAYIMRAK